MKNLFVMALFSLFLISCGSTTESEVVLEEAVAAEMVVEEVVVDTTAVETPVEVTAE